MQLGKDFFEMYLQTFTVHLLKFNIYGLYYEILYHFRMNIQNMGFSKHRKPYLIFEGFFQKWN